MKAREKRVKQRGGQWQRSRGGGREAVSCTVSESRAYLAEGALQGQRYWKQYCAWPVQGTGKTRKLRKFIHTRDARIN